MIVAAKIALAALLIIGSTSEQQPRTLLFEIGPRGARTAQLLSATAAIMRRRLAAAQIDASVKPMLPNYIKVVPAGPPPRFLERLLSSPGRIVFRITPHGDYYRAPSGAAIRAATASRMQTGEVDIDFSTSDPKSFLRFTTQHLGQRLGIYLDGRLLSNPMIDGPISDSGLIVGRFTREDTQVIAGVLGSGPLPVLVKLIGR